MTSAQPKRFVILVHDHPFLHWDFMLEQADGLSTWRLHDEPAPHRSIVAERLPDHRLAYLDYEGPVRGNRGHVTRWTSGWFACLDQQADRIHLSLDSLRLSGIAVLQKNRDAANWTVTFQPTTTTAHASPPDMSEHEPPGDR